MSGHTTLNRSAILFTQLNQEELIGQVPNAPQAVSGEVYKTMLVISSRMNVESSLHVATFRLCWLYCTSSLTRQKTNKNKLPHVSARLVQVLRGHKPCAPGLALAHAQHTQKETSRLPVYCTLWIYIYNLSSIIIIYKLILSSSVMML